MTMVTALWIGLGGFLGANVRYWLGLWIAARWGTAFPYGTLWINLSGSCLLCFLVAWLSKGLAMPPALRLALTVGFLGSYTTFSTFSTEWLLLFQDGQAWRGLIYIGCSVVGGGVAGGIGLFLGRCL